MSLPHIGATTVAGLTFDASFDSGNCSRVEQVDDDEFNLFTSCDCACTPFEKSYRTWFAFAVRGVAKGRTLAFNIHNMNAQGKLFRADMRPVYRSLPSKPAWNRLPYAATHTGTKEDDNFVLRFKHRCDGGPDDTVYFAFCFPLSYTDSIARLAWLDALFQLPAAPIAAPPTLAGLTATGGDSTALSSARSSAPSDDAASSSASSSAAPLPKPPPALVASAAEMAVVSRMAAAAAAEAQVSNRGAPSLGRDRTAAPAVEPPNLKVPHGVHAAALEAAATAPEAAASPTLSDLAAAAVAAAAAAAPSKRPNGVYYHRELLCRSLEGRRVDLITISGTNGLRAEREPPLGSGLMPEGGERPRAFSGKTVFVLTARVHPGETPASHVLDGFLQFLLRENDPRAIALRERFVFKLVPMINPDGVFRGHYRADTRGLNLNRCYLTATPEHHPSVHAIMVLVRQLHERGELQFYIDTHAHASKRGCFLYGNAIQDNEQMIDNVMFAKLVSANCRWFDFGGCVFSERNMVRKDLRDGLSKEGSGRVAVYKMTGLTHVYTLECNYNTGRLVNRLQPPHLPRGVDKNAVSPPPPPIRSLSPKYTPECWRSVGKALALAALDFISANPCSRLGPPSSGGFTKLRGSVAAWVRTNAKKEAKRASARRGDSDDEEEGGDDEEEEEEEEGADSREDSPILAADNATQIAASMGDDLDDDLERLTNFGVNNLRVSAPAGSQLIRHAGGHRMDLLAPSAASPMEGEAPLRGRAATSSRAGFGRAIS